MDNPNDKDLFDKIYDACCKFVDEYKIFVGAFVVSFIIIFMGQYCFNASKVHCKESIIDMAGIDRECYNGAKIKHINDQWVCSCEK